MEAKKKPKAFNVYLDTYEHVRLLDIAQRGELLTVDRERVYAECAKICERIGTK